MEFFKSADHTGLRAQLASIHAAKRLLLMMYQWFSTEPMLLTLALRCLVASFCGIIVGMERAYRAKPAGIRTHMLISLGSCMFMGVSLVVAEEARRLGYTTPDPGRIAAQVVTGIGFLGAGAIIRNRGFIRGMTSAATIWCMSAIGLAAGAGMLLMAASASIGIVFILRLFDFIEKRLHVKHYRLRALDVLVKKEGRISEVRKVLRALDIIFSREQVNHILGEIHYRANLLFLGDLEEMIESNLRQLKGVKEVLLLKPDDIWDG